MADFERAFKKTLNFEGGYADTPGDAGGKTMYGITEKIARAHGFKGKMRDLTLELAKRIYLTDYWQVNRLDKFPSQALAENVFDAGVNMGTVTAAKLLQKVVGVAADGMVGKVTLAAINKALETLGEQTLIGAYLDEREARYHRICAVNPSQVKFLKGWLARCNKLRREIA